LKKSVKAKKKKKKVVTDMESLLLESEESSEDSEESLGRKRGEDQRNQHYKNNAMPRHQPNEQQQG